MAADTADTTEADGAEVEATEEAGVLRRRPCVSGVDGEALRALAQLGAGRHTPKRVLHRKQLICVGPAGVVPSGRVGSSSVEPLRRAARSTPASTSS